jgi:hypothetical protein
MAAAVKAQAFQETGRWPAVWAGHRPGSRRSGLADGRLSAAIVDFDVATSRRGLKRRPPATPPSRSRRPATQPGGPPTGRVQAFDQRRGRQALPAGASRAWSALRPSWRPVTSYLSFGASGIRQGARGCWTGRRDLVFGELRSLDAGDAGDGAEAPTSAPVRPTTGPGLQRAFARSRPSVRTLHGRRVPVPRRKTRNGAPPHPPSRRPTFQHRRMGKRREGSDRSAAQPVPCPQAAAADSARSSGPAKSNPTAGSTTTSGQPRRAEASQSSLRTRRGWPMVSLGD